MRIKPFHLSATGFRHMLSGKDCQDAATSYSDDDCAIAIVCDGHGGDDYVRSALGSAYACEIAKEDILTFIRSTNKFDLYSTHALLLPALTAQILSDWQARVYEHAGKNPFTKGEIDLLSERAQRRYLDEGRIEGAYGTTLLAVALTRDYWFGLHIGDGKCVSIDRDGVFTQPIPWDKKCFLNYCTSLCDPDAADQFRTFFSRELPAAVLIGTDGVNDCFNGDTQLNSFYKTILRSFAADEFEKADDAPDLHLDALLMEGSRDDMSIAGFMDPDAVLRLDFMQERSAEKEENAPIADDALKAPKVQQKEKRRRIRFCRYCGRKLLPLVRRCGECERRSFIGTPLKYCEWCGEAAEPDMDICLKCGTALYAPDPADEAPARR